MNWIYEKALLKNILNSRNDFQNHGHRPRALQNTKSLNTPKIKFSFIIYFFY